MKTALITLGVLASSIWFVTSPMAATPAELLLSCIQLSNKNCAANPASCQPPIIGEPDTVLKNVCEHALKGTFISQVTVGTDGTGVGCAACINVQNTNANSFSAICQGKLKGKSVEELGPNVVPSDNRACFYGNGIDLGL